MSSKNPSNNLREIIKEEYKKCLSDPLYFVRKYVKISTQDKGVVPFEMFPYQEESLRTIHQNQRTIILKSRQMGISTLMAAYVLWVMLFKPGKNILVISKTREAAIEVVAKIKLANEELPSWLKIIAEEDNKLSLKLKNGSKVLATSSASDSARGYSTSLCVLDEACFVENIDELWAGVQQTLANTTDGQAIILSTPNGVGGFFYKTWIEAENKTNGFIPIKLKWDLHPKRNQEWRERQTRELGVKLASQECDASFISSGTNLISLDILEWYENDKEKGILDPIEKRYGNDLWIWRYAHSDRSKSYVVSADTARGDGNDFSAAHIFDVETNEQVAEYKGQFGTTEYGSMLVSLATEYNNALLIVERENVGWATIQAIIDRDYDNLFYSSSDLKYVDVKHQMKNKYYSEDKKMVPGFSTNIGTRLTIINRLESYIREKSVIIRSIRTINELKTFVWEKGKVQAMSGYNDDLCMSLAINLWVRDTALRLKQEGVNLTKNLLDRIHVPQAEKTPVYTAKLQSNAYESWKMKVGGGQGTNEDLTWLIK
jgi:hypothetical protein